MNDGKLADRWGNGWRIPGVCCLFIMNYEIDGIVTDILLPPITV